MIAKADSGASSHCFKKKDKNILQNIDHNNNGPTLLLPNLQTITATQKKFTFIPFQKSNQNKYL